MLYKQIENMTSKEVAEYYSRTYFFIRSYWLKWHCSMGSAVSNHLILVYGWKSVKGDRGGATLIAPDFTADISRFPGKQALLRKNGAAALTRALDLAQETALRYNKNYSAIGLASIKTATEGETILAILQTTYGWEIKSTLSGPDIVLAPDAPALRHIVSGWERRNVSTTQKIKPCTKGDRSSLFQSVCRMVHNGIDTVGFIDQNEFPLDFATSFGA